MCVSSRRLMVCINMLIWLHINDCKHLTDSSTYAHYVFNVFDQDHDGTVSFEVCISATFKYINYFQINDLVTISVSFPRSMQKFWSRGEKLADPP